MRCRARALVSRAAKRDPGPRGHLTCGALKPMLRFATLALGPGSRSARASALAALARDTRAEHASRARRYDDFLLTGRVAGRRIRGNTRPYNTPEETTCSHQPAS